MIVQCGVVFVRLCKKSFYVTVKCYISCPVGQVFA